MNLTFLREHVHIGQGGTAGLRNYEDIMLLSTGSWNTVYCDGWRILIEDMESSCVVTWPNQFKYMLSFQMASLWYYKKDLATASSGISTKMIYLLEAVSNFSMPSDTNQ